MIRRRGEDGPGEREQSADRGVAANEVEHGPLIPNTGAADRKSDDRAPMVLELATRPTLDGPVTRTMNPRGHIIRHEVSVANERLYRQNSHIVEFSHDPPAILLRFLVQCGDELECRGIGANEDSPLVAILYERIEPFLAGARSHPDYRHLSIESDQLLRD